MPAPPDLEPESVLSKIGAVTLAPLFYIEPELAWGLLLLVMGNTLSAIWWATLSNGQSVVEVLSNTFVRLRVYLIGLPMILVISNMVDALAVVRTIAFTGVAGWEIAVALGILARIHRPFRGIYIKIMEVLQDNLPMQVSLEDVRNHLDDFDDSRAEKNSQLQTSESTADA